MIFATPIFNRSRVLAAKHSCLKGFTRTCSPERGSFGKYRRALPGSKGAIGLNCRLFSETTIYQTETQSKNEHRPHSVPRLLRQSSGYEKCRSVFPVGTACRMTAHKSTQPVLGGGKRLHMRTLL